MTYDFNKNIFKNSSASLDSISELCSAINSTVVATVHENFTSQH